jgi:signal transduction histidine kinase
MDSAQGSQSIAYVNTFSEKAILSLDLGQPYQLSRIHLHAIDQSDTVPQAHAGDLGMPYHLQIEGANDPEFSDAIPLLNVLRKNIYETGPIMMWRIPAQTCRFVRLIAEESGNPIESTTGKFRLGFAEIELFSQGVNVALNRVPQANAVITRPTRSLTSLTDGNNLYGRILPVRNWLEQLAQRHRLEAERPVVAAELNRRYLQQKKNLIRMKWVAIVLIVTVALTILIDWILRMKQAARLRERFAADLHDELGANLHAIGLLGDLAKEAIHSPDELIETVDEIRALTERTSATTRYFTALQQAGLHENLSEDMQRTARRIMADLEYDISIEGNGILEKLKPRTKADLFLFYKESLVNISRHSGATRCSTQLTANHREVCLIISDNGQGISGSLKDGVPKSLKRRARLLGAKVSVETSTDNGTNMTMTFRPRKLGFWR